jgi:Terpene synthase family 2, C-terminal metal binding
MPVAKLPSLYCPFPQACSPYVEDAEQHTAGWVRRFSLLPDPIAFRRFCMAQFGSLAAATHPYASRGALDLVTDWCSWLFILDDQCDESGLGMRPDDLAALHRRLLAILRGAEPGIHDEALAHGLRDLRQRTLAYGSSAWMRRFTAQIAEYFAAGVWEARNRARGAIPDLASYVAMRPYTGGIFAYIELLSATSGVKLPPRVRTHPIVQQLTCLANNVICWANDILSYAREQAQGDVHNLVLVMQHERHLVLQQAVERVTERHNAEMQAFLAAEAALPRFSPTTDSDLDHYVEILRNIIRGSFDWAYATARHASMERAVAA